MFFDSWTGRGLGDLDWSEWGGWDFPGGFPDTAPGTGGGGDGGGGGWSPDINEQIGLPDPYGHFPGDPNYGLPDPWGDVVIDPNAPPVASVHTSESSPIPWPSFAAEPYLYLYNPPFPAPVEFEIENLSQPPLAGPTRIGPCPVGQYHPVSAPTTCVPFPPQATAQQRQQLQQQGNQAAAAAAKAAQQLQQVAQQCAQKGGQLRRLPDGRIVCVLPDGRTTPLGTAEKNYLVWIAIALGALALLRR